MKWYAWLGVGGILLAGCSRGGDDGSAAADRLQSGFTKYADGFEVLGHNGYKLLRVHDPWQNSRNVTFSYVLAGNRALVPDSLSGIPLIRIPVRRVITLSTTHVAMIRELGMGQTIKGVSGSSFIYNPEIRNRIEAGAVHDVGYDQGLNYETIVSLDPDVLFMYGVEGSVRAISEKLAELGVPVVYCAEYLETHPLGKAEWIRFFSLFYGLEDEAGALYNKTDSSYRALVQEVSLATDKPLVFTGLPWKDTWYMAGGQSYAARLIEDAGGSYLWQDNPSAEAVPLDLESVYARAMEADIWINPGAAGSLEELRHFDERFSELPVLKNGLVFNNNNRMSPGGGNDYWESGTVRPDLVLADLIAIFHPELMTDHPYIYYRKLK